MQQRVLKAKAHKKRLHEPQSGDVEKHFEFAKLCENTGYYHQAVHWYYYAAMQNHPEACIKMAGFCKTGFFVQKDPLVMIAWYNRAYANGYSVYPQSIIIEFLIHFCNDPRYNPNKTRFSDEFLKQLDIGLCSGLTIRFLAGAWLEKNKLTKSGMKDDLEQFHREINTILSWDGIKALTPLEEKCFFSFLYLVGGYHKAFFIDGLGEFQLDRLVFVDDDNISFKREFGCTLSVTQDQMVEKLDVLRQPNRMIVISIPGHTMGIFDNYFYGSNTYQKSKKYLSSREIAKDLFEEINGIPNYPINRPITISIDIYTDSDTSEFIPANYPSYSELLADSAFVIEGDPIYRSTALHLAVKHNHIECVKHFLQQEECDIYVRNDRGSAALHFAAFYGRYECLQLLLAKNCDVNLMDSYGATALQIAALFGHIDCVELLLGEEKCAINLENKGRTAFHHACSKDHLDTARLLLARGANLNFPAGFVCNDHPDSQMLYKNVTQLQQERQNGLHNKRNHFFTSPDGMNGSTKRSFVAINDAKNQTSEKNNGYYQHYRVSKKR